MARGRSVIVGGGLATAGVLAVGALLYVSVVDPPTATVSPMMAQVTGAAQGIVISSNRADPQAAATEVLRVKGGAIIEGSSTDTVCIGRGSTATASNVVAIGRQAAGSVAGTVIGNASVLSGGTVAIEGSCTVGGSTLSIAIGGTISGGTGLAIAIGGSVATSANSGRSTTLVGCSGSITSGGTGSTVIGAASSSSADACVVVGCLTAATHAQCILFGIDADSFVANSCLIGGSQTSITLVCTGKGDTSSTPASVTFRLTNGQTGSADVAGGDYTIVAGRGTGAGVPGAVQFAVGVQTGTSSTLQVQRTGAEVRFSSTATHTYLLIYDVDNATLERVTVGAADSGGAGFKVLRIPN